MKNLSSIINNIFLSSALVGLVACEQVFMKPTPATDPQRIFDQVWAFADQKYSFFDFKKVDWNASKTKFQSKINKDMSEEELFGVCNDMLYDLRDGHVNLISKFNVSRNPEIFLDYPTNLDNDVLQRNYFKGRLQSVDQTFGMYDFGDVIYVRYSSFSTPVSAYALNYVLRTANNKKGIVFDMRNNGGGSLANVYSIASRFVDKKTFVGMDWEKIGVGREDFRKDSLHVTSFKIDDKITDPKEKSYKFTQKPVVLLVNRGCYSATNFFAMFAKEIPNFTLMGSKTGGGGGVPATTELSNGWTLRVSASRTIDPSGFNIEDGLEPDIEVNITEADRNAGKDTILDRALAFIRK